MYKPTRGGKPSFGGSKKFGGSRTGGSTYGRKPSFGGDRERNTPMLYDAVCAECASKCQVPFRPNGKKPVLCRDCFGGNEGGASFHKPMSRPSPRSADSRPSADTALLREISAKLDAILTALHA